MALRPSRRLFLLLLLSHLAAAAAFYAARLPLAVVIPVFSLLLLSLVFHLARDVMLSLGYSWRHLGVTEGGATIVLRNGVELTARILGGSVVTPWFVVVRVKPDGGRIPLSRVIFSDALDGDQFRELCVRLRYSSAQPG